MYHDLPDQRGRPNVRQNSLPRTTTNPSPSRSPPAVNCIFTSRITSPAVLGERVSALRRLRPGRAFRQFRRTPGYDVMLACPCGQNLLLALAAGGPLDLFSTILLRMQGCRAASTRHRT
ncbi:hypothetical protein U9M48_012860 [Paspalum notatum var. saurae]|uniref:Uncharacterized protein n=1 Tax=Paspalum notatum var. saurae TaxID=547442 RepID=A0AAQ3SYU6_PASNO